MQNDGVRMRVGLVAAVVVVAAVLAVVIRPPITEPALAHELIRLEREANEPLIPRGLRGVATLEPGDDRLQEFNRRQIARTERLKELLDRHGWPTTKMVGREGVYSAVRQLERVNDPTFVASILPQVLRSGERWREVAYLVDINAVQLRRPQTFGTQWTCRDGRPTPEVPLKDPDTVDVRRKQYGLPPMSFEGEGRESFCTDFSEPPVARGGGEPPFFLDPDAGP